MEQEYKYMVCTSCFTYNHAPYIVDAMNGFVIQETSFPYVCVIVDDYSTDGEQEVIKQYLNEHFEPMHQSVVLNEETDDYSFTYARHKTNHNCYFAVFFLKYNHYSIKKSKNLYFDGWSNDVKYIAMCEGDDYWTHPKKLQIQVEFLEQNKDYTMCFHNTKMIREGGIKIRQKILDKLFDERDYNAPEFIEHRPPTASLVYRKNVVIPKDPRFLFGDNLIFLSCSTSGKVRCIKEIMSIYRRHPGGVSIAKHFSFIERVNNIEALIDFFPICKGILDKRMACDMTVSLILHSNERKDIVKYVYNHPIYIKYLFQGCYLIMTNQFF